MSPKSIQKAAIWLVYKFNKFNSSIECIAGLVVGLQWVNISSWVM